MKAWVIVSFCRSREIDITCSNSSGGALIGALFSANHETTCFKEPVEGSAEISMGSKCLNVYTQRMHAFCLGRCGHAVCGNPDSLGGIPDP